MIKCEICGREYEDYISLGKHIRKTHKILLKDYYDKYVLKGANPICEICGAEVKKFYSIGKGYVRTCSKECACQLMKKTNLKKYGVESTFLSEKVKEKIKQTNLKKYGTEYAIQSKEIREKVKQTNLKKYGVENVFASDKIKEKIKQTNLRKYNVEYPVQSKEIKGKMKQTNLKKYGAECSFKSEELKEKSKQTCMKKYGTEYANQAESIRKKIVQTNNERYGASCVLASKKVCEEIKKINMKKYGTEYALQNSGIRSKIRRTMVNRYGVEFPGQSNEIREKIEQTNFRKYGVKSTLKVKKIRDMIKQTNIEKYGSENPLGSKIIRDKVKKTNLERYGVENAIQKNITNFDKWNDVEFNKKSFLDDENYLLIFKMMDFFNVSYGTCYIHMKDLEIDYSLQRGTSHYEQEIFEFLQSLNIKNIVRNDRELICPKELDFYLPDYKLAIEFDGIFWHSEQQGKTKRYHLEKTDACEEKGVQLIHILETEWVNKKEIIKSILKSKLHKLKQLCYARQCKIKEITIKESGPFLNKNHRQGAGLSSIKLGAYFKDELVAVMTFSKPSIAKGRKDCGSVTNFEISRFAPKMDYHIPGVASKLFSFFKKNYSWEKVLTFADRRYSSKALYDKIGFKLIGVTEPCYWYFKQGDITLKHRFKYRKSELKRLLKTFDPKLTEYQNMVRNNFDRVWDVGNLKFEYSR